MQLVDFCRAHLLGCSTSAHKSRRRILYRGTLLLPRPDLGSVDVVLLGKLRQRHEIRVLEGPHLVVKAPLRKRSHPAWKGIAARRHPLMKPVQRADLLNGIWKLLG